MDIAVPGESTYELGPIRPPSEAHSLLIRVTCNCPWNRCRFCPIYKGKKFSLRDVDDIRKDMDIAASLYRDIIDRAAKTGLPVPEIAAETARATLNDAQRNVAVWTFAGARNCFLQDANSLIMKTPGLVEVIRYIKNTFPSIERITTYARSKTAAQKTPDELKQLREAGLSRIHIGLESGYNPILDFLDKGTTAEDHIRGGRNVKASGISLSEYIMPGAGGKQWWREHALETARVLNEINPDYIRLRTLTVQPRMELAASVADGSFIRADDELTAGEIRLLMERLDVTSRIASDHIINLLPEVEGQLPDDKEKILAVIDRFLAMPQEEKDVYKLGRRLGVYERLDDLEDPERRTEVERVLNEIRSRDDVSLDEVLYRLLERYI